MTHSREEKLGKLPEGGDTGAELEDRMEGKRTPGDSQFPSLNSNDSRIIYAEIW